MGPRNLVADAIRTPPVDQIKDLERVPGNLVADAIRTPPVDQIKDLERVPGNLVADAIIFTQFAEFTLTIEDAQEYVYSISPTKRVRGWRDIEVKLYI